MGRMLQQGAVYIGGRFVPASMTVSGGTIAGVRPFPSALQGGIFSNLIWVPGFIDVHVHLREPGFSYKETIATGSAAAAAGGYTTVCAMPNLTPAPDSAETLAAELAAIRRNARIRVLPYGTLTKQRAGREMAELAALAPYVCAFSDDGSGVADDEVMRTCMREAKRLGKIVAAHCEDLSVIGGKSIHAGAYARRTGRSGISSESEWRQVARDLTLAAETGCAYHVCHVSTKESVALIRQAKRAGVDVSCETAPHYLLLTEDDLQEDGRFKMNPPLRTQADREALLEGLDDGTIDMVATDHAPHSAEEKSKGLDGSAMGIVGLETAFSVLYTGLVEQKLLTLEKLIALLHDAPAKRFGLGGGIAEGARADLTCIDLSARRRVEPERFYSLGRATPFAGWTVTGQVVETICGGETVFQETKNI